MNEEEVDRLIQEAKAKAWDEGCKEGLSSYRAEGLPGMSERPRQVTTVEELDALPDESLVLASGKTLDGDFTDCWIRPVPAYISGSSERRVWETLIYGDSGYRNMTHAGAINFPATVLYEPNNERAERLQVAVNAATHALTRYGHPEPTPPGFGEFDAGYRAGRRALRYLVEDAINAALKGSGD